MEALAAIPGVKPYPSDANYILFAVEGADQAWAYLYDRGVLIRDFSSSAMLEGTLRAFIGTPEQNDAFLAALEDFVSGK